MIVHFVRYALVAAVVARISGPQIAAAGELTKEECVDAHSRGQDAKEQGRLSLARKLFLTCAQPSCPSLVQGDCARFVDDLGRQQPSLSFAARDGNGADLPDTTVYVDDVLIVARLDDGRPHDVDPGKHTVRFQNSGKEKIVTVIVGTGEKGRTVVATFGVPSVVPTPPPVASPPQPARTPEVVTKHPLGARVLLGVGTVLIVGGGALGVWGTTRVPAGCSVATHQCAAPPGDPIFASAASAMRLTNYGIIAGATGVAALVGGAVWYFKGAKTTEHTGVAIAPWITPTSGGFSVSGDL